MTRAAEMGMGHFPTLRGGAEQSLSDRVSNLEYER